MKKEKAYVHLFMQLEATTKKKAKAYVLISAPQKLSSVLYSGSVAQLSYFLLV